MPDPSEPAAHNEAGGDPSSYDYSSPTLTCDVVMKGGITSGVVYPHAICELARVYRLVSIGGTSAGAIAAAAAAAAEHGRAEDGFAKLAALPDWLAAGTNLRNLFQPQRRTARLLRLIAAARRRRMHRGLAVAAAAVRAYPLAALAGAVPGLAVTAVAVLSAGPTALRIVAAFAGIALALVGGAATVAAAVVLRAPGALTRNGFGLCSGMPATVDAPPALTPWLADLLDDLAGKDDGAPLTFGDLRHRGIELAMVTTNVTQRRPHRLPLVEPVFSFDPEEWRRLFPEHVVRWLADHPRPLPPPGDAREQEERERTLMLPRLPLPQPDDLPVVVAARLSLSFPVLVSAVPLWAIDRTTRDAVPERCWFSDGGASSNFPVHFFDAPLPERPTFGIDLDGFHPDHPREPDEAANVWLPGVGATNVLQTWHRFRPGEGAGRLYDFANGLVRTMQSHVDTALAHQPGYRERIVHVHHDADEGGLNLGMPPAVVRALARRGREAGRLLVREFADGGPTSAWDGHRWVRYRSAVAALAELAELFEHAWESSPPGGERGYRALLVRARGEPPREYPVTEAERALALTVSGRLAAAGRAARTAHPVELGGESAPEPEPEARIVPRD
jgi:predicted acylesterase/phospholipase RssA